MTGAEVGYVVFASILACIAMTAFGWALYRCVRPRRKVDEFEGLSAMDALAKLIELMEDEENVMLECAMDADSGVRELPSLEDIDFEEFFMQDHGYIRDNEGAWKVGPMHASDRRNSA